MGHSVIPAENDEKRPVDWEEDDLPEPEPIVLTGEEAIRFVDEIFSRTPRKIEALTRAAELHRKMVISE